MALRCRESKRLEEALASYDRAIALKPDYSRGSQQSRHYATGLKRLEEALASYDRAIALKPDYAEAYNHRGLALQQLQRLEEALASYDRAIALKSEFAQAHAGVGGFYACSSVYEEAVASYDRRLALKPIFLSCSVRAYRKRWAFATGAPGRPRRLNCLASWTWIRGYQPHLWSLRCWDRVQITCALREYGCWTVSAAAIPAPPQSCGTEGQAAHWVLFVGLHNHAVAWLIAEVIERHDRRDFEIIGFSLGVDNNDEMRRRLASAFDRFIDVRSRSDRDVALLARSLGSTLPSI